ncbi:MAG: O-antigen ligase family protein [Elusimicrobiota bacterium]|jgi:O-antigen ligase
MRAPANCPSIGAGGALKNALGSIGLEALLLPFFIALPVSIAGANMGWGLMLLALLCKGREGIPRRADLRSCVEFPLWSYLCAAALAGVFALDPMQSLRHFNQDAHKLWMYYLLLAAGSAFPAMARRAPLALAAGALAAALAGISQSAGAFLRPYAWQSIQSHMFGAVRAHAFVHPVTFGEQMAVAFLGAFCFLAAPEPEVSSGSSRRVLWAVGALFGLALFLSNTRGALLGAAAGVAVVLLLFKDWKRMCLRALVIFTAVVLLMEVSSFFQGRSLILPVQQDQDGVPSAQFLRVKFWGAALRMGLDHPLTGVGPNGFRAVFRDYYSGDIDGKEASLGNAHNVFLHQFAERGFLGLGALLLLFGAFWLRARERVLERPDALNLWAYAVFSSFIVMNLTETALQVELVWMLVWTVWILAELGHRSAQRSIA